MRDAGTILMVETGFCCSLSRFASLTPQRFHDAMDDAAHPHACHCEHLFKKQTCFVTDSALGQENLSSMVDLFYFI